MFDYRKTQDFLYYVERLDNAYMEYIDRIREAEERKRAIQSNEVNPKSRMRRRG